MSLFSSAMKQNCFFPKRLKEANGYVCTYEILLLNCLQHGEVKSTIVNIIDNKQTLIFVCVFKSVIYILFNTFKLHEFN